MTAPVIMHDNDSRDDRDTKNGSGGAAGPLAELNRHIAAQRATMRPPGMDGKGPALDPDWIEYFRGTWNRVRASGQLRQSLQRVPDNAGPLNSSHLLHRALTVMEHASPAYLREFLAYADAVAWLEGLVPAQAPPKEAGRAAGPRKSGKPKARK
ncbi:DUF2894 domain-containing protein [Paracidovorax citrulli]